MNKKNLPGIYLMVEFDWPKPVDSETGKKAQQLHKAIQNKSWIRESVVANGGLGDGRASVWVFWLENYAALDRLLRDRSNEVSQAYMAFFSGVLRVTDKIREEVIFKS